MSKRPSAPLRRLRALRSVVVGVLALSAAGVAATDKAGTAFLEAKSKEEGVVTLPSGLRFKVLTWGRGVGGELYHPMPKSPCAMHYTAAMIDGKKFDSSFVRGEPSTFGSHEVIKGWGEAMPMMVEGDKWELYIPSQLAYGRKGKPPKIPPNAAVVYTVEMIEIIGDRFVADDREPPPPEPDEPLGFTMPVLGISVVGLILYQLRKKQGRDDFGFTRPGPRW